MLNYFSVKNFKSIRDEIALDMRPAPRLRRLPHHVLTFKSEDANNDTKVLRSAVIYGANASGKSNIVRALEHAKNFVTGKIRNSSSIKFEPFKLDNSKTEDTEFYIEFSIMGFMAAYGFSHNNKRISHEYLYTLEGGNEQKIFDRKYDEELDEYDVSSDYSPKEDEIKKHEEFLMLIRYTEKTKLFVTESFEKRLDDKLHSDAKIVLLPHYFFRTALSIIFPNSYFGGKFKDINEEEISRSYKDYLNRYDTGITNICTEDANLDDLPEGLISRAREMVEKNDSYSAHYKNKYYSFAFDEDQQLIASKIITCRTDDKGERVDFELDEESDGTARLFDILKPLVASRNEMEITYVIDEFDRSLHPNISKDMINRFLNEADFKNPRQLIVTTHESNILDNDLLRRDEIWFVQKERNLSTSLYSLNDYSTRFDKDIKNAYLKGAFGGIPYLMEDYKG
ncbi:AAA family ATPase [Vibrio coralliilyticus]|uniref:AAA family ATPase n=1 Tax=Vibrio coralliilyticus TaxID=190893 RepID=UPI00031CE4F8|nr:ATP-binding protein [Vibrio coralliilyticus]